MIDVGGGASRLVDCLLEAGYEAVTVLDIAAGALEAARQRLGTAADAVQWLEADVTTATLPEKAWALWHDRAVFHFLTDAADRAAYLENLARGLRPGGQVIVATFAEDGPDRCSGLPVVRYSPESLERTLGAAFRLEHHELEDHYTPGGALQRFLYCRFRAAE
ncbi:MAG: class I SAM-dependent methyltransferase [Arhodomonas sp.]|nr:class I SAM-dependent methyltransferase [Arhodomonas sp.]